jgi:hypothetical protein
MLFLKILGELLAFTRPATEVPAPVSVCTVLPDMFRMPEEVFAKIP